MLTYKATNHEHQSTLVGFEPDNSSKQEICHPQNNGPNLYQELKDMGYVDSRKANILRLLSDLQEHHSDQVARVGGKQYGARILELRRNGWDIVNIRDGLQSKFQLRSREKRW